MPSSGRSVASAPLCLFSELFHTWNNFSGVFLLIKKEADASEQESVMFKIYPQFAPSWWHDKQELKQGNANACSVFRG